MIGFCVFKTRLDEIDVGARCLDACFRLLLEGVNDVDRGAEADGVDGAVGVAVVGFNQFDDAAAEPLEGFVRVDAGRVGPGRVRIRKPPGRLEETPCSLCGLSQSIGAAWARVAE